MKSKKPYGVILMYCAYKIILKNKSEVVTKTPT